VILDVETTLTLQGSILADSRIMWRSSSCRISKRWAFMSALVSEDR
jgi:hypothetical protein